MSIKVCSFKWDIFFGSKEYFMEDTSVDHGDVLHASTLVARRMFLCTCTMLTR